MSVMKIKIIEKNDLIRGIEDKSILLIDVREKADFAKKSIPGALSLPLSSLDMRVVNLLSEQAKSKKLSLFGKNKAQIDQAVEMLSSLGVTVNFYYPCTVEK